MQLEDQNKVEPQKEKQNWTKMYVLVIAVLAFQIVLYYWFTNTFS